MALDNFVLSSDKVIGPIVQHIRETASSYSHRCPDKSSMESVEEQLSIEQFPIGCLLHYLEQEALVIESR